MILFYSATASPGVRHVLFLQEVMHTTHGSPRQTQATAPLEARRPRGPPRSRPRAGRCGRTGRAGRSRPGRPGAPGGDRPDRRPGRPRPDRGRATPTPRRGTAPPTGCSRWRPRPVRTKRRRSPRSRRSPIRAGCRRSPRATPPTPCAPTRSRGRPTSARSAASPGTPSTRRPRSRRSIALTDAAELLDVAQNAEHRDVALRAFDRVDRRRRRDLALAADDRNARPAEGRQPRAPNHDSGDRSRRSRAPRRRGRPPPPRSRVCDAVERLADVADVAVARAELARLTDAWRSLGVTDERTLSRFAQAARPTPKRPIARRERDAEEAAERARLRAEAIATRDALCARVETLDGDDVLEQLGPIEEEWRSLMPLVGDGPEADRLAERFAQAVAACRKRHEMGAMLAETRAPARGARRGSRRPAVARRRRRGVARWQTLSREARGLTAVLRGTSTRAARPT